MRTAIFLGITSAVTRRWDSFDEQHGSAVLDGWDVKYVRSSKDLCAISERDVQEALEVARLSDNPHIIASIKAQSSSERHETAAEERKKAVTAQIQPFIRICWIRSSDYGPLSSQTPMEFFDRLNRLLECEDAWDDKVRPDSVRSPLLLPQECFDCAKSHDVWEASQRYGDLGNVEVAANAAKRFTSVYFKSTVAGGSQKWTDLTNRVYNHQGPRHRSADFPQSFKYSYPIEPGFHYDVTTKSGRLFKMRGAGGTLGSADAGKHLNIDPHGYILGED